MTGVEAPPRDRRELARAITLLESTRAADRKSAEELLREAAPHSGNAIRIAVSGAPGVGKSTFIEAFGAQLTARGHRLAVLTIDPSSSISGGSILGDKTRMPSLAANARAFIRPSPAGATLGGVAARTREAIVLCEAAGYDVVIVETLGVGQAETIAANMTDMFLYLVQPGGGDELQGIKRGIMELADMVIVNKADGEWLKAARAAAAELQHALRMLQPRVHNWQPPVLLVSSRDASGVDEVLQKVDALHKLLVADDALQTRRRMQTRDWLWREVRAQLATALQDDATVRAMVDDALRRVQAGEESTLSAAGKIVTDILGR